MPKIENARAIILGEYEARSGVYGAFGTCLEGLLTHILRLAGIKPHSISCRLKTPKSLEDKLSRPGKTYSQLADITDITGVRVITYFAAEVDQVAALLEREFEIDREHCVDKRIYEDPDRFGYKSLHYVLSLKSDRAALPEYSAFENFKAEIQLRTVIQHAWAEIEHDLGYKSLAAVPKDAKRKFFRLAALLEMADEEFTSVKDALTKRTSQVRADLQRGNLHVDIDKNSLAEFTASDPIITDCDDEIARRCDRILSDRWLEIDLLATWLRSVGVTTIQQLRKLFTEKREAIIDLACSRLSHKDPFTHGVSILYVCYYVAAREGGAKRITDFLESNQFGPPAEIEKVAAQIMDTYSAYSGGDTAHPKPVTK